MAHADARLVAAQIARDDPTVERAEPDHLLQPQLLTHGALPAQPWSLADGSGGIRATTAWSASTGQGVVVAVIDSGERPHADLVANLLPGCDFIVDGRIAGDGNARDADAYDPGDAVADGYCGSGEKARNSRWHGTQVAGIVAAVGNNGAGMAGVAHGAKLLRLRALGRCGGYTSDIADAMVWAAGGSVTGVPANANPARVINLSLGGHQQGRWQGVVFQQRQQRDLGGTRRRQQRRHRVHLERRHQHARRRQSCGLGSAAATLVLRVARSSGVAGGYQLALTQ